jgi:raffinose/stachyose/melibiose transport system substrate-binding protein
MGRAGQDFLITTVVIALLSSSALAQQTTLDVTAWKGNDAEPAGLPQLIEKFETEHPEIAVKFSYISRLDTNIVLPPRLQGDNPPDVMMVDMPLVEIWADAGLLSDLGQDRPWYGQVVDGLREAISAGDVVHVMPLEVIGMGNFVNMGLLKQAGIAEPPKTISELKATCTALSDAGINPMIFTGSLSATLFSIANGLARTDAEAAELGSDKKLFIDDPAFSAVLDTIRDLIDAKCFDPKQQAGLDPWSTALAEFQGGNFAMMPQGAWNIAVFSTIEELDYAFAPIPADNETGVALDLFGIGWAISAGSDQHEAARTFVEFFAEEENLQVMLDAERAYSPFKGDVSGMPEIAAPYDEARRLGGKIDYPFALLQWPKTLEEEMWDSLTGFLLDPSQDNADILERWDEAVADDF